jgi:hypothetical protein
MSQPPFFVHGSDGREYPVDADTLGHWLRAGRVTADQMVYVSAEGRWVRVRDLPQFRYFSTSPQPEAGSRLVLPVVGIGCLTVFLLVAVVGVIGRREQVQKERKSIVEREKVRRERQQVEARLRQNAPGTARIIRERLASLEAAERSGDIASADAIVSELRRTVEPYLTLQPVPEVLVLPISEYRASVERVTKRAELLKEYNSIAENRRNAEALAKQQNWIDADDALEQALGSVEKLRKEPEVSRLIPSFAPGTERAAIQKERRRIATRVTRQRREAEQRKMLAALCGEKPFCSAWDGECGNIESALKRVAHDPGSIDVENCTDPVLYGDQCWVTTCDVRGKNAFGALIRQRKRFSISQLGVEEVN